MQTAEWEIKAEECPQCGNPTSMCTDRSVDWYAQREVCLPTMVLAQVNAEYDRLHKDLPYHDGTFTDWAKERDAGHPYQYREGVRIWVSPHDLTPDDEFLGGQRREEGAPDGDPPREGSP